MSLKPKRIIEAAVFDGDIGPLSARELMAMPNDDWGLIRDRITDRNNGKRDGLLARCMCCGGRVFVQSRLVGNRRLPFFAHYKGGDPNCPWYHGRTIQPDEARAAQYGGQQESIAHRLMCEKVAEIVQLDPRCRRSEVNKYLPPTENAYGRFPDVFFEWAGLGSFVVEIQLSRTFQTEISERCLHYDRENKPLLWLLYGLDPQPADTPQSFQDVIRRHRGNAFLLDHAAVRASYDLKTLVLSCFLRRESDSFEAPVLVRFDELVFPSVGLPYFEDRIVPRLLNRAERERETWRRVVSEWNKHDLTEPVVQSILWRLSESAEDKFGLLRLIAAVLSIVATATGEERNFATAHPNIRAMLNTLTNTGSLRPYAKLLERFIGLTSVAHILAGSVGEHLRRAQEQQQVAENSFEWRLVRRLVPECMDAVMREELSYFDALPSWAKPVH